MQYHALLCVMQTHAPPPAAQLPLRVFMLDVLPWTTTAQLVVWAWRFSAGAAQGCLVSMLVFVMGGLVMPITLLHMSEG